MEAGFDFSTEEQTNIWNPLKTLDTHEKHLNTIESPLKTLNTLFKPMIKPLNNN